MDAQERARLCYIMAALQELKVKLQLEEYASEEVAELAANWYQAGVAFMDAIFDLPVDE